MVLIFLEWAVAVAVSEGGKVCVLRHFIKEQRTNASSTNIYSNKIQNINYNI